MTVDIFAEDPACGARVEWTEESEVLVYLALPALLEIAFEAKDQKPVAALGRRAQKWPKNCCFAAT